MPQFRWKALDADGTQQAGRMEAFDHQALESELEKSGLTLIHARKEMSLQGLGSSTVGKADVVNFSFQLSMMLKAGVPLFEALRDIAAVEQNPALRKIVADVLERLQGGQTLSSSLGQHPKVFDEIYVSLVHAGEQTGQLTHVLEQLTETLKWQHEMASQTKQALIYPVIVLIVISAVMIFLLGHVVPQITGLLKSMRIPLPWQTQVLMAISDFIHAHMVALMGTLAFTIFGLPILARIPALKGIMDSIKLHIPILGPVLHKIALARFAYVFALLYAAGVSVMEALEIVETAVGNKSVARAVRQGRMGISAGRTLSHAFSGTSIIPPMVVSMLRVGESTGGLDLALGNVSYLYTRQAREAVQNLQATLQPILTVVLGLILAMVMVFTLGPLYDSVIGNARK